MGTNLLIGYTGAYQDPVNCGYALGNGYRMYLPELMRFNVPDSWSPFGKGGIHPYAYCACDPINHADPSGRFSVLSLMVEAIVAEEAANVAARGLADAAVAAREEGAVDAALAAASATRATAVAVDEGGASSSRAAESVGGEAGEPPAKRPRQGEPEMRRWPGPDEPGSSDPDPSLRVQVRNDLDALEQSMRQHIDPLFNQGEPTLRELYAENDFDRILPRIRETEQRLNELMDNVIARHSDRLGDIRRRMYRQTEWREEQARANRLGQEINDNLIILQQAWERNPDNPEWEQPN